MHRRTAYALGAGVLLVLSASILPAAALSAAPEDSSRPVGEPTDAAKQNQTESDAITALEAMQIVENETNGTVVGVRQRPAGGGNGTPAYEVHVVQGNRTGNGSADADRRLTAVDVHAINGTILGTETQTDESGFFEADESTEGIAVSNSLNLSTTRSAVNATQIAVNQSAENVTVREVRLTLREQVGNASTPPLVYEVGIDNAAGERVTIVVSARKGQEGIITVEPQQDESES